MKHLHHIVPRHAGGSDDSSNLVCLTIEEHAQAHKLLYEQYGRWQDELAYKALSGQITNAEVSLQANILANTGKYNSPETKLKKSLARKSKPSNSKNYKWSEDQKNNLKKIRQKTKYLRSSEENEAISARQSKKYLIISPDGQEHIVFGLVDFCKNNNLNRGVMSMLYRGKTKSNKYKGYSIKLLADSITKQTKYKEPLNEL